MWTNMKQLVLKSILMLVVMAADTEEDMEISFTFKRYWPNYVSSFFLAECFLSTYKLYRIIFTV